MFRKAAITFLFLVFLGVGFFWLLVDQRLDGQDSSNNYPKGQSEAASYCLFKEGTLLVDQGIQYCLKQDQKETVEDFFNRLGA